jgi:hypothetical protein
MTSNPVDRMFRVLVRTLRTTNPALLSSSFSVGEIHQQILPYRHFRRELGLQSNQEYELTLMRLLSGEGGFLDVDEKLRDGLSAELASAAPEPSRVREFADSQVSIMPAALEAIGVEAPAAETVSPQFAAATKAAEQAECRYCSNALPAGRTVNFCPFCGQNLRVRNCPACGAELESGWRFCLACGKGVQSSNS